MPLITPEEALEQTRGEAADATSLDRYARAAERSAMKYMARMVYASQEELDAARTSASELSVSAATALKDAQDLANAAATQEEYDAIMRRAQTDYNDAMVRVLEMNAGIVIEADIKIAMLLTMAHLYAHREATTLGSMQEIPLGARYFLDPYRVGMGV